MQMDTNLNSFPSLQYSLYAKQQNLNFILFTSYF